MIQSKPRTPLLNIVYPSPNFVKLPKLIMESFNHIVVFVDLIYSSTHYVPY